MVFEKKSFQLFFRIPTIETKIWLTNLDLFQFFCGKRLKHYEKHVKVYLYTDGYLCIEILKTIFVILVSDLLYPISSFSIFTKTWKLYLHLYLVQHIKFVVSIFIGFSSMKFWISPHTVAQRERHTCIHKHKHIHTRRKREREIFKNQIFELMEP